MSANSITVVKHDPQLYINYATRFKVTPGSERVSAEVIGTLQHPETRAEIPVKTSGSFSAKREHLSAQHPKVIEMIATIFKNHITNDPNIRDPRFYPIPDKKGEAPTGLHESFTKEGITQPQIARVGLGVGKPIMEYSFSYNFSTEATDAMKWRIDFNGRVKNLTTGADFPASFTAHVSKKDCPTESDEAAKAYGLRILNPISPADKRFSVLPQPETAPPADKRVPILPELETASPNDERAPVLPDLETASPNDEQAPVLPELETASPNDERAPILPELETAPPNDEQAPVLPQPETASSTDKQVPVLPQFETNEPV